MLPTWRDLPFILPMGLILASPVDSGDVGAAPLAFTLHVAFTVVNGRFGRVRVLTWCLLLLAWTTAEFAGFVLSPGQLMFWIATRLDDAPGAEFVTSAFGWLPILPAVLLAIDMAVARRDEQRAHMRRFGNKLACLVSGVILAAGIGVLLASAPANDGGGSGLLTPAIIVPPWYFRADYALLRAVPDRLASLALALTALLSPMLWPLARADRVRHSRFGRWFLAACAVVATNWLALSVVGGMPSQSAARWLAPLLAAVHCTFFLAGPFVWRQLGRNVPDRVTSPTDLAVVFD